MYWRDAFFARAAGLASGRVYWGERPQGVSGAQQLPALVMDTVSDNRPQILKDWDLAPGRIQIDTYGATPESAWEVMEAAIATLVPGGAGNGHTFQRAEIDLGPRGLIERIGSTTVFRVSMDLIVYHAENGGS